MEDDVLAIGVDSEVVGQGFVESALPPFVVGVGIPAEFFGAEGVAPDAEDGDLLPREGRKGVGAKGRGEVAVVGVHDGLDVKLPLVVGYQRDVAKGVVFAKTCATEVGNREDPLCPSDISPSMGRAIRRVPQRQEGVPCSFGQIVVFLFTFGVDEVGVLLLDGYGQGVAITHNGVGDDTVVEEGLCRSVATDEVGSLLQHLKCYGVGGVVSCCEDDSVISCCHLKYPYIAMRV